jgi:hypothetical protein
LFNCHRLFLFKSLPFFLQLTSESAAGQNGKTKQAAEEASAAKGKSGVKKGASGKVGGKSGGKDSSSKAASGGKFPVKLTVRRKKKKSEKDVYGTLADKVVVR